MHTTAGKRQRWPPPWWAQLTLSAVAVTVGIFWLRPQFAADRSAFRALQHLSPVLIILAAVGEAASLVVYSLMSRTIFRSLVGGFADYLTIDLTTTGLSHVLPAGGPAAAVNRYRMLREAGVAEEEALSGSAVQATTANSILVLLLFTGLVCNLGEGISWVGSGPALILIMITLALLITVGIVLSGQSTRPIAWSRAVTRRLPDRTASLITAAVAGLAAQLAALRADPRRSARMATFALVAWLCDASALWLMLAAFGVTLGPGPLLVAYAVGNLLVMLPLTPGGLGLVEGSMVPVLISFHVDPGIAIAGVLGWRVFQFWLPIPVGGLAYAVFRWRLRSSAERGSSAATGD